MISFHTVNEIKCASSCCLVQPCQGGLSAVLEATKPDVLDKTPGLFPAVFEVMEPGAVSQNFIFF